MKNHRKLFWLLVLLILILSLSGCGPLADRLSEGTAIAGGQAQQPGEEQAPSPTLDLTAEAAGAGDAAGGGGMDDAGGGDDQGDDDDDDDDDDISPDAIATAIALTNEANTATPEPTSTTEPTFTVEGAQFTALAQTLTAEAPTATSEPTNTFTITPTGTATITPTPDGWVPSPTPAPCLALRYVADVTIPDGTVMQPGEVFYKTWRVQNIGSCRWTPNFSIVYFGGLQMGGTSPLPIGVTIYPGRYVNLTIQMVAPSQGGVFRGEWGMMDEQGNTFGLGSDFDQPFYLEILVIATGDNAGQPVFVAPASTDPGFTPAP